MDRIIPDLDRIANPDEVFLFNEVYDELRTLVPFYMLYLGVGGDQGILLEKFEQAIREMELAEQKDTT